MRRFLDQFTYSNYVVGGIGRQSGMFWMAHRIFMAAALSLATLLAPAFAGSGQQATGSGSGFEMIMVEQDGCVYCERWHAEIGPAYPKTEEGAYAPIRMVDITAAKDAVALARAVNFTPTFVLAHENREVARLEGYMGDEFFWVLLDRMLKENTDYGDVRAETPDD